jgi:hypothetical protein
MPLFFTRLLSDDPYMQGATRNQLLVSTIIPEILCITMPERQVAVAQMYDDGLEDLGFAYQQTPKSRPRLAHMRH